MESIRIEVKICRVEDEKCSLTLKSHHQDWKNQRRKRREQFGPTPLKRSKVIVGDDDKKGPLQLSCKISAKLIKEEDLDHKLEFEVMFIDGEAGKDGLAQIVQFLKNKAKGLWTESQHLVFITKIALNSYHRHEIVPFEEDQTYEFKGHWCLVNEDIDYSKHAITVTHSKQNLS